VTHKANIIDHNFIVMDMSGSMDPWTKQTIQVVDNHIGHLARQTEQDGFYESRMTVYQFDTTVECVYYEMDVLRLRLRSMADTYKPRGLTALVKATTQAIEEVEKTATLYGDHAFLGWVVTDGAENASSGAGSATYEQVQKLNNKLTNLPPNWIVACLVPSQSAIATAMKYGFPRQNIEVWNPSAQGIIEVGERLRTASDNYMKARQSGVASQIRSSGGIFNFDLGNLTKKDVESNLTRLTKGKDYDMLVVQDYEVIRDFVEAATGRPYHPSEGKAFYEFTKTEEVQPKKDLAIRDRNTGAVYAGKEARQMLGIPEGYYKIKPQDHPEFDLFIQSTSVNRKLQPGTNLIVMK
jgi:hypothetical protein